MAKRKVLISIDESTLHRLDEDARALGLTRSAYVSRLVQEGAAGGEAAPSGIDEGFDTAFERIRALVAGSRGAEDAEDTTTYVRRMRDEHGMGGDERIDRTA